MNALPPITARQRLVLQFVAEQTLAQGFPPTLREIADHVGLCSTNGVSDHLRAIERKGFISRTDLKSRGIVVLQRGYEEVGLRRESSGLAAPARLLVDALRRAGNCPANALPYLDQLEAALGAA